MIIDDMYLTNNDDYTPQLSGLSAIVADASSTRPVVVYSLSGQVVSRAADARRALQQLNPGIYIIGGRKVVVK